MSLEHIREAVRTRGVDLSLHAHQEALDEGISASDIAQALLNGIIIEDYPTHERGPCCLVYGQTEEGRDLHVVIASSMSPILIITVYEPTAPYWTTPVTRGKR